MEIRKAQFRASIGPGSAYFNNNIPEIAIVGKSNSGKSSLVNWLTNNTKLARVSKEPGKTRLINYFMLNDAFYLVDLPGYGFARISKEQKGEWDLLMGEYFSRRERIAAVLMLMDIRHAPTVEDTAMLNLIEYYALPYAVVATKADKIAKTKRKAQAERLRLGLKTSFEYPIIPVSSFDGYGKSELLREMKRRLDEATK